MTFQVAGFSFYWLHSETLRCKPGQARIKTAVHIPRQSASQHSTAQHSHCLVLTTLCNDRQLSPLSQVLPKLSLTNPCQKVSIRSWSVLAVAAYIVIPLLTLFSPS